MVVVALGSQLILCEDKCERVDRLYLLHNGSTPAEFLEQHTLLHEASWGHRFAEHLYTPPLLFTVYVNKDKKV